jgi:uncharacterized membrane protein YkoI
METFMTTRSLPYLRLAIIGLALCCQPSSFAGQELAIAGTAKVKPEQARSIALKARPGAITSEELEKEKGGSGFRYSFVVKSGTVLYEVGVDAQTGKVLENSKEGPNPD